MYRFSSRSERVADGNADMVDGVNMLATMLKATPIVRAGDELGRNFCLLFKILTFINTFTQSTLLSTKEL